MTEKKKRGGAQPGAGRKKSVRPIAKCSPPYLYADQLPTTSAELRNALDFYRRATNVQQSSEQGEPENTNQTP